MILKAGTILVTAYGEYSDRGTDEPVVVVRDFDPKEVEKLYRKAIGAAGYAEPSGFTGWLHLHNYITDLPCASWYLGAYGLEPQPVGGHLEPIMGEALVAIAKMEASHRKE